jgi:hypothetical protein
MAISYCGVGYRRRALFLSGEWGAKGLEKTDAPPPVDTTTLMTIDPGYYTRFPRLLDTLFTAKLWATILRHHDSKPTIPSGDTCGLDSSCRAAARSGTPP